MCIENKLIQSFNGYVYMGHVSTGRSKWKEVKYSKLKRWQECSGRKEGQSMLISVKVRPSNPYDVSIVQNYLLIYLLFIFMNATLGDFVSVTSLKQKVWINILKHIYLERSVSVCYSAAALCKICNHKREVESSLYTKKASKKER